MLSWRYGRKNNYAVDILINFTTMSLLFGYLREGEKVVGVFHNGKWHKLPGVSTEAMLFAEDFSDQYVGIYC